jgi:hypothetical protein
MRDAGPGQTAVQLGSVALRSPGDGQDADRQIKPPLRQLRLGRPRVRPPVHEPGKHVRAEPALPFLLGGELRELEGTTHGDVLQQDRAWQLIRDRLDHQHRRMVAGNGDGDGADLARCRVGQAQRQHGRDRVAVRRIAGHQRGRVHRLLVVIEQGAAGRRIHQVQPHSQLIAQLAEHFGARPARGDGPAEQLIQARDPPKLPGLLAVIGVRDRAHHRRKRHAERHRQHRQRELARPAGPALGQQHRAGAEADRQPARAGFGQPLDEVDLRRFLGAQPRPVGEQQFTRAMPFPRIGQIRGVHPADLTVDARIADDQ